jgi:hypothetical protein
VTPRRAPPTARELARVALVALVFAAAPTAGDIGSCGQTVEDLDATKFFVKKAEIDCARCTECDVSSFACGRACSPTKTCDGDAGADAGGEGGADAGACGVELPTAFLPGCYPLVHDGEVCLHALEAASCSDYAAYMADQGATAPTECNFCPPGAR